MLPSFNAVNRQKYFIDVFLSDDKPVSWTAAVSNNWLRLSTYKGVLYNEEGKKQIRIWVDIDWKKLPGGKPKRKITFTGDGKQVSVEVNVSKLVANEVSAFKGFIENNGYVSMNAASFYPGSK